MWYLLGASQQLAQGYAPSRWQSQPSKPALEICSSASQNVAFIHDKTRLKGMV